MVIYLSSLHCKALQHLWSKKRSRHIEPMSEIWQRPFALLGPRDIELVNRSKPATS